MEKKKVAIVTLGDSRREFYKKREAIVASEIEKVKKAFKAVIPYIMVSVVSHLLYLTQKMDKIFLMRSRNRALKL